MLKNALFLGGVRILFSAILAVLRRVAYRRISPQGVANSRVCDTLFFSFAALCGLVRHLATEKLTESF